MVSPKAAAVLNRAIGPSGVPTALGENVEIRIARPTITRGDSIINSHTRRSINLVDLVVDTPTTRQALSSRIAAIAQPVAAHLNDLFSAVKSILPVWASLEANGEVRKVFRTLDAAERHLFSRGRCRPFSPSEQEELLGLCRFNSKKLREALSRAGDDIALHFGPVLEAARTPKEAAIVWLSLYLVAEGWLSDAARFALGKEEGTFSPQLGLARENLIDGILGRALFKTPGFEISSELLEVLDGLEGKVVPQLLLLDPGLSSLWWLMTNALVPNSKRILVDANYQRNSTTHCAALAKIFSSGSHLTVHEKVSFRPAGEFVFVYRRQNHSGTKMFWSSSLHDCDILLVTNDQSSEEPLDFDLSFGCCVSIKANPPVTLDAAQELRLGELLGCFVKNPLPATEDTARIKLECHALRDEFLRLFAAYSQLLDDIALHGPVILVEGNKNVEVFASPRLPAALLQKHSLNPQAVPPDTALVEGCELKSPMLKFNLLRPPFLGPDEWRANLVKLYGGNILWRSHAHTEEFFAPLQTRVLTHAGAGLLFQKADTIARSKPGTELFPNSKLGNEFPELTRKLGIPDDDVLARLVQTGQNYFWRVMAQIIFTRREIEDATKQLPLFLRNFGESG